MNKSRSNLFSDLTEEFMEFIFFVMAELFVASSEQHIKKEREKARKLKKTRWWQEKIQKGECFHCGKIFSPKDLTMDHQQPLARGGRTGKNNVVTCCKTCNSKKSHKTLVEIKLSKDIKD